MLLQFPDYRSTFEAHYRIPWLPLFPKSLAAIYLKILGKPILGLSTINYVTKGNIMHLLHQSNCIEVTDLDKIYFQTRTNKFIDRCKLKNIGYLGKILTESINLIFTFLYTPVKRIFRTEKSVAILVKKL